MLLQRQYGIESPQETVEMLTSKHCILTSSWVKLQVDYTRSGGPEGKQTFAKGKASDFNQFALETSDHRHYQLGGIFHPSV